MTISPISQKTTISLEKLTQDAEELNHRKKSFIGYVNRFFLRYIEKYPTEVASYKKNYYFSEELFKGKFIGRHLEEITPLGLDSFLKFIILYEKVTTQMILQNNFFSFMTKYLSVNKHLDFTTDESTSNPYMRFMIFHKLSPQETELSPLIESSFYFDVPKLKTHPLFSQIIGRDDIDSFRLEYGNLRAAYVHRFFKSLNVDQSSRELIQKYVNPSLSERVLFLLFVERKKISFADMKLKSLEDPLYRLEIEAEYADFKRKYNSSTQPKPANDKDKLEFMKRELEELLADEQKRSDSRPIARKNKKAPKAISQEVPTAPPALTSSKREALKPLQDLITCPMRILRKSEWESGEWQTPPSPSKPVKIQSPMKIAARMLTTDLPKIHPRIRRWECLNDLKIISSFSDCMIEDGVKKTVLRYKDRDIESLSMQLVRHLVPNNLACILASKDFQEKYCYRNGFSFYIKARADLGENLCEETIVSYGLNSENILFHFFIHPSKEVEWSEQLSEVAQNLDTNLLEASEEESKQFSQEISFQTLSGSLMPAIQIKYFHPLISHAICLEIFPRSS